MPKLRLQVPTPTAHMQCAMDQLVRDFCLCFYASPTTSYAGVVDVTNPDPGGPHLSQAALVFGPVRDVHQST